MSSFLPVFAAVGLFRAYALVAIGFADAKRSRMTVAAIRPSSSYLNIA
jgi:hypothetical protein